MPDLGDFIPERNETVEAIYAHYKKCGDAEPSRGYLGASIIGSPCDRFLWFCFRDCCRGEFNGRMYRLLETGDIEEPRLANNLTSIGCEVHTHDENGEQFSVSAFGGHFSGHLDAAILRVPEALKTWHVGEFKTHSDKNFRKLAKHGVKSGYPRHYCQMLSYMHLSGRTRALYVAANKNTDELYTERIRYDKREAELLMDRIERIIMAQSPPKRLSDRPDWWQCRFCDAKDFCFGSVAPNPVLHVPTLSCRQCCYATPVMDGVDGRWVCEKRGKALSRADQLKPCDNHLTLPGLLPQFPHVECTSDESGNDCIVFSDDGGGKFKHGKGTGKFSSEELTVLPAPLLMNAMVTRAKDVFDGTATACCEDILDRYPAEECEILWRGNISGLMEALVSQLGHPFADDDIIARTSLPTHCVAEYEGGIIAIAYLDTKRAEIRKRKT